MLSSSRLCGIAAALTVLLGLAVVAEGRLAEKFIWNELQFDWPSPETKEAALKTEQVSVHFRGFSK